jgi:group II intron reverse transcriptase/maturase
VYIPKADGRQRAIGVPTLEDKLVQRAATEVLSAIYETDFKGFSYGSRPNRGAHNALDAVTVGIETRKVNWVLDADIRGFFDAIDHEWMLKFVEHRIADRRVLRHLKKWLNAGVLEQGVRVEAERGTPQGGSISPRLANIYLHYTLDLWADHWRRHEARGEVILVRYVDDFLAGFQVEEDARRFREELGRRLEKFGLELHGEKTRVIEFGRFVGSDRSRRGQGKPETFDFLGFTHCCGKTKKGRFCVLRRPMRKRTQAKLKAIQAELRRRMHDPVKQTGAWLRKVVQGYYRYYAVPRTSWTLQRFRYGIIRRWYRVPGRRSQKKRITWPRMYRLANTWLPYPRIVHPYPSQRLHV